MRTGQILLSAVHLIISVCMIALGAIMLRTFTNETLSPQAFAILMENTDVLSLIGVGLIGFGFLFISLLFFIHKNKYYEVCVDSNNKYVIDPKVLQAYTKHFWQKSIGETPPYDVYINRKGELCIIATMDHLEQDEEIKALEKIETDLAALLFEKTGFNNNIIVKALKSQG